MREERTTELPKQPIQVAERLRADAERFAEQIERLRLEIAAEPHGTIEGDAA